MAEYECIRKSASLDSGLMMGAVAAVLRSA